MARDITMIFSVLVSILSLIFGVYKNVEAGNAKAFAFQQAYQIIGIVDQSSIGDSTKSRILADSLSALGAPAPVLDFSSSRADTPAPAGACSSQTKDECIDVAQRIASLNASCTKPNASSSACAQADSLKQLVEQLACIACFHQ